MRQARPAPGAVASGRHHPAGTDRLLDLLFLATVSAITFEKLHWNVAGQIGIADILTILFLVRFAARGAGVVRGCLPRTTITVLAYFAAFLVVYSIGFFNLETDDALAQFAKGMVKFVIHFLFLAAATTFLVRRGRRFYLRALAAFVGGAGVNALYGVAQLFVASRGGNLDDALLSPLTGGASSINIYGAVDGQSVFRPNAITGDPNHLGVMLIVPLLTMLPVYLRLESRHRLKTPLALTLAFLLIVELATLSRSGLLGLAVGALVLGVPYRRYIASRALLLPIAGVVATVGAVLWSRRDFFSVVLRSRVQTGGGSESVRLQIFAMVPDVLEQHPLFGLGLNNFSVYYEFVTGRSDFGPHSFYVAVLVETGLIGTALFAVFLAYVFRRLAQARALGRRLTLARHPAARRMRPLAWGMTAALVGTLAANVFYLTIQFYYFYVFVAFALALPLVYGRVAPGPSTTSADDSRAASARSSSA